MAVIRGRVLGPRLTPVADLDVELLGIDPLSLFAGRDGDGIDVTTLATTTGRDGRFVFTATPPRSRCALRLARGTANDGLHLLAHTLVAGETTDVGDIVLARKGAIRGRVLLADGRPAAGARVTCGDGLGALRALLPIERLSTERGALIALPEPAPDEADAAFARRLRSHLGRLFTETLDAESPDLALHVLEDPGWAETVLRLLPLPTTVADAAGEFELVGVEPGPNLVCVQVAGAAPTARQTTVAPGRTRALGDLRVDAGVVTAGVVIDPTGAPVPGAEVRLAPLGRRPFFGVALCAATVHTDVRGGFVAEGLPDGDVLVAARRSPAHRWVCRGPFDSGEHVRVALPPTPPLVLRVMGEPTPDADALASIEARLRVGPPLGEFDRAGLQAVLAPRVASVDGDLVALGSLEPGIYTIDVRVEGYAHTLVRVQHPTASPPTVALAAASAFDVAVVGAGGAPVAGARVFADSEPTAPWTHAILPSSYGLPRWSRLPSLVGRTGADGRLRVDGMARGTVHVAVEHGRHGQASVVVTTPAGAPVEVQLPGTATVRGTLTERGKPAPPEHWMMRLERTDPRPGSGMPWRTAQVALDRDGRFRATGLTPGSYRIVAVRREAVLTSVSAWIDHLRRAVFESLLAPDAASTTVTVARAETAEVTLDLDRTAPPPGVAAARLLGQLNVGGKPRAGVAVLREREDWIGSTDELARTDALGRFAVAAIAPGEHRLRLVEGETIWWRGTVQCAAAEATSLQLDWPVGTVRGEVRAGGRAGIGRGEVRAVASLAGGTTEVRGILDVEGRFELTLPHGTYAITATSADHRAEARGVEVPAGDPLIVAAQPRSIVSGRAIGAPAGARLGFHNADRFHIQPLDASGTFRFEDVPTGTYAVEVFARGVEYAVLPATVEVATPNGARGLQLRVDAAKR